MDATNKTKINRIASMNVKSSKRLLSLDVFRGLTMFLLMGEAARVYASFTAASQGSWLEIFMMQFHHHPWNGLRFWDLIQPFFMFIVGVAMPFSYKSRSARGDSHTTIRNHIFYRCFLLFLFGTGLHCVYSHKLVWELWNVLTQLSFTILVAFFLMRLPWKWQLGASALLLVLTEVLYRGYDPAAPFVKDANFGSYVDLILMGKINNGGGWVTINCLPTAAHTIWGVVCGQLLLSEYADQKKLRYLIIAAISGLAAGYLLDLLHLTPIIKRIATSSFVLASGGWAVLVLALFYWWIDLRGNHNGVKFFSIVGMNSIFIYLFAETIGHQWLGGFTKTFNHGFLGVLGIPEPILDVTNALLVWAIMWYLCYFLYKKKIFFKI